VGYDILRMHPERASYTDGRPWLENYDAAYLDFLNTIGPPKPGEKRMIPGTPARDGESGLQRSRVVHALHQRGTDLVLHLVLLCRPNVADTGIHELAGSRNCSGSMASGSTENLCEPGAEAGRASNVPPSFDPVPQISTWCE